MFVNEYLPQFTAQDYDAFRRIAPSVFLFDTFNGWEWDAMKSDADLRRSGHIVVRVKVNVDEFTRYCDASGHPRNADSLLRLVREKGERNEDCVPPVIPY